MPSTIILIYSLAVLTTALSIIQLEYHINNLPLDEWTLEKDTLFCIIAAILFPIGIIYCITLLWPMLIKPIRITKSKSEVFLTIGMISVCIVALVTYVVLMCNFIVL